MLRVRIDGGQLSSEQLRVISGISVKYARGTADVTDRQNIQLHWIEIESVPEIWAALEWHCRSCARSFQLRFAGIGAVL